MSTSCSTDTSFVSVSNDTLVTVRTAMRELNRLVERLERGDADKFVLTKHGKMVAAIVPLSEASDLAKAKP